MSAKFSSSSSQYFSPTFKGSERENVLQAYPRAPTDVKSPRKETVAQAAPRKSFMDIYGYDPVERSKNPMEFVKEETRIYYYVMGIDPPPGLNLSTNMDKPVDSDDTYCSSEQNGESEDDSDPNYWPYDMNSILYSDYEDDSDCDDDVIDPVCVSTDLESDSKTESSEECFDHSSCGNAEVANADTPAAIIADISKEDYIRPVDTDEVIQAVNSDEYTTTCTEVKFDILSILSYISISCEAVSDTMESLVELSAVSSNQFVELAVSVYPVFDGDILQFRMFDPGGINNIFSFANHMLSSCCIISIYIQSLLYYIIRVFSVTVISISL